MGLRALSDLERRYDGPIPADELAAALAADDAAIIGPDRTYVLIYRADFLDYAKKAVPDVRKAAWFIHYSRSRAASSFIKYMRAAGMFARQRRILREIDRRRAGECVA